MRDSSRVRAKEHAKVEKLQVMTHAKAKRSRIATRAKSGRALKVGKIVNVRAGEQLYDFSKMQLKRMLILIGFLALVSGLFIFLGLQKMNQPQLELPNSSLLEASNIDLDRSATQDPLKVTSANRSFELIGVSADRSIVGYYCNEPLDKSASMLAQALAKDGWIVQSDNGQGLMSLCRDVQQNGSGISDSSDMGVYGSSVGSDSSGGFGSLGDPSAPSVSASSSGYSNMLVQYLYAGDMYESDMIFDSYFGDATSIVVKCW